MNLICTLDHQFTTAVVKNPSVISNALKNATCIRSTASLERLSSLTLLDIESEIVHNLDFRDIIDSSFPIKSRHQGI